MEAKRVIPWVLVVILLLLLLVAVGCAVYLGVRWDTAEKNLTSIRVKLTKTERELKQLKAQKPKVTTVTVPAETEKVPDDIPLYPDFEWTPPLDSQIFRPGDNDVNRVVISSHRQVDKPLNWYRERLSEKGWTNLWSAASMQTNVHAEKNGRRLSIFWQAYVMEEPGETPALDSHGGYLSIYYHN